MNGTASGIKHKAYIVAARDLKGGIGYKGKLPWPRLHSDLKFLHDKTCGTENKDKQNAVIMGRHSWEGLPKKIRPLSDRYNIVLSSTKKPEEIPDAHMVCSSLPSALDALQAPPLCDKIESIFILGGSGIFGEAMSSKLCEKLFVTEIYSEFQADTFYPSIDSSIYKLMEDYVDPLAPSGVIEENGVKFKFTAYERQ